MDGPNNSNDTNTDHERNVSWGDLLSKLKTENDQKKKMMMMKNHSSRTIRLSDVISSKPVEQEAETHIMRAVEKVAAGHGGLQRRNKETDSLFQDIAADEISRAAINNEAYSNEDGDEAADMPDFVEPLLRGDEEEEEDSLVEIPLAAPSAANSFRGPASANGSQQRPASQSSLMSNGFRGRARFKNLVKKHMAETNSVEQTLFGLTTALTHMDDDEKKLGHTRVSSQMTQTSSDRLDKTAEQLVAHATKKPSTKSLFLGDVEAQDSASATELEDKDNNSEESEDESTGSNEVREAGQDNGRQGRRHKKKGFLYDHVTENIEESWSMFSTFFGSRKAKAKTYLRQAVMYIMLPSLAIAAILFYLVENPSLCEKEIPSNEVFPEDDTELQLTYDVNGTLIGNTTITPEEPLAKLFVCPGLGASASWWFLFIGVRQVVTFSLALLTQTFLVDYLALATRFCLAYFGPVVTLFLVQAKGWPMVATFWAVYGLILNAGDRPYAQHWGYWSPISMFTEDNPSGDVVNNEWNLTILNLTIFIGVSVSLKRLFVALFLGRQTFARYGEQLAEVMKNMVLIGEVASLASEIERFSGDYANIDSSQNEGANNYQEMWTNEAQEQEGSYAKIPMANAAEAANAFVANRNNSTHPIAVSSVPSMSQRGLNGARDEEFSHSEHLKLSALLDEWEPPQMADHKEERHISIGAVLQFRQALAFMKVRFPFLPVFGLADTRESCLESAQKVYDRLLLRTPDQPVLAFDTLAILAKDEKNGIDQTKAKLLIKTFRPDRQGMLTKLDFVKSIDQVYKSIRLLSANISNSSQIDGAMEGIFNGAFYFVLGAITLSWLGVDPLQVFLSFSSVILAFAFMFGSSSSKYFEGILFILVQAPYGVGDRIHLSRPEQDTSIDGSSGWIVEKVSLYTTSVYWGATNERATLANGAISNLRIINAARSPNAQCFVNIKFALDTPFEKIEIFQAAIEQFLKDRPREWLAYVGFRPTEVAVEQGFINYVTIAQHRNSWQDIGGVLSSKAELVTYELEVAKQLEMKYSRPHLPVDLRIEGQPLSNSSNNEVTPNDIASFASPNGGSNE